MFQAMSLLGIGPGHEVVLPTISFVGAANAIAAAGARPVFCDVDLRTLNPTAQHLEEKTTERTRAYLILHYGGLPCDLDGIVALARRRGVALIEDSACSVASRYRGKACGTFGDIGTWSFDAMKILVCGDGGMLWAADPARAQQFEENTYLGLMTKSGASSSAETKWWQFEISGFGRRAIMNDVSSAIGLEQLKKLPRFIARRRAIHERYSAELKGLAWLTPPPPLPEGSESSYYFYWVQSEPSLRDGLSRHLREQGIYTTFRYYPLHLVERYGVHVSLPAAERAAQSTLCIPIHHSLRDDEVESVIRAIHGFGRTV